MAKELKMTIGEIGERMDAQELSEWMAYFLIQDEKEVARLNQEITNDKDQEYHSNQLRSLFKSISKKKFTNGSNK